jgi:hypothetical protein
MSRKHNFIQHPQRLKLDYWFKDSGSSPFKKETFENNFFENGNAQQSQF